MRLVFWLLLAATILSALWALFLFQMYPLGAADTLYGDYRSQLDQAVGRERANQLTEQASRTVCTCVQGAAVLVGVPLLVTNAAWALFAHRLMRGTRANRTTIEAGSADEACPSLQRSGSADR